MVLLVLLTDYTSDVPTSNGSCLAISHNMACFARSGSCGPCRPKEKPFIPIENRPLLGMPEAAALCGLNVWISSLPERPQ